METGIRNTNAQYTNALDRATSAQVDKVRAGRPYFRTGEVFTIENPSFTFDEEKGALLISGETIRGHVDLKTYADNRAVKQFTIWGQAYEVINCKGGVFHLFGKTVVSREELVEYLRCLAQVCNSNDRELRVTMFAGRDYDFIDKVCLD